MTFLMVQQSKYCFACVLIHFQCRKMHQLVLEPRIMNKETFVTSLVCVSVSSCTRSQLLMLYLFRVSPVVNEHESVKEGASNVEGN